MNDKSSEFNSHVQPGDEIVVNENGERINVSQLERVAKKRHHTSVDLENAALDVFNATLECTGINQCACVAYNEFKKGAMWQKMQMCNQAEQHLSKKTNGEIMLEDTVAFDKGFNIGKQLGAEDMKEQMLKKAVVRKGILNQYKCVGLKLDDEEYKAGDLVTIIIIKES